MRIPTSAAVLSFALAASPLAGLAGEAGTPADVREVSQLLARPLTAESAVRIARAHQPQLRAALRDVEAARARRAQARALPNPELTLDFRGSERAPLASDIEVSFDLGDALQIPARTAVADARVEMAQREAEAEAALLEYRVRIAFFDVQAAQNAWRLAVSALDAAVAARDAARALLAAGNLAALTAAQHEAASELSRVEAVDAELAFHATRERLSRLLGVSGAETDWRAEPASPSDAGALPSLDDLEGRAVEASLELARMRAERKALEREARLTRATGWLPELSLDLHAERDDARWDVGGGVRVVVPLFDRRRGELAALRAQLLALESRYRAAALVVRSQAREARNRAVVADARALHFRERALPAAQRVVAETLLQHNAMQVNVFELLDAKRVEIAAERAASGAALEAHAARAALVALLAGAPLEASAPVVRARAAEMATAMGGH